MSTEHQTINFLRPSVFDLDDDLNPKIQSLNKKRVNLGTYQRIWSNLSSNYTKNFQFLK